MKMNTSIRVGTALAVVSLLLAACGGGGYSGDVTPSTPPIANATGLDRFLLFPNPQAVSVATDRPYQTESEAYALAYYEAIDPGPNPKKDTLEKWKRENKFDTTEGNQVTVVFGDKRDLGYGRRMTARYNPRDQTIAFLVENYVVSPGGAYSYSKLSLEAAAQQDVRWRIGINAIEFSPGPSGGVSFAKFFNFNSRTGQRELMVDLDFRGPKAMPGPCITCHGGRADALNQGKFPLIQNTASKASGDVQAHLAPFEVDSLDFLDAPGLTRNDQEDELKLMNLMVLCTYPSQNPNEICAGLAGATRRQVMRATENEWEGASASRLVVESYKRNGIESDIYHEPRVPDDWVNAGQSNVYSEVVAPTCRMCHMLRGTSGRSDIDFESYEKFKSYRERIKVHVFDRGNMPLAKLVYDTFWDSNAPEVLATFLENQPETFTVRDPSTRAVLQPGRPIADPGPDRVLPLGATTLSAAGSLFADTYSWSLVSGPTNGASLTGNNSAFPTFTAALTGQYVLQLVVSKGISISAHAQLNILVDSAAPATINFSQILITLQACAGGCHQQTITTTPVFWDIADYEIVRSRINFTDVVASPLLQKPTGQHHGGNQRTGFDISKPLTEPNSQLVRKNYDLFLNWIQNGAPQ